MPTADSSPSPAGPPRQFSPMAGLLSYLVPGLGQIVQGRVGKGLLFFVCIYALFFYGMYLGSGSVTYAGTTYTVTSNVYLPDTATEHNNPFNLPRFAANLYNRPQFLGQFWVGVAAWPALWQYFNYDKGHEQGDPLLGEFQRTPSEEALNAVHTARDKRQMELGWVYTVIAGVLNIMVIYDACAGPAFLLAGAAPPRPREAGA
jgi:hypothetical protein